MKPLPDPSHTRRGGVCCHVAADAVARVSLESLPELRRNQGQVLGNPLPASFLKHADEQTIVGLAAVYRAINIAGLPPSSFGDWGVVAAPRFLGRPAMAAALQRFAAEGAWGVSPHLIPHRSLHSISGTVSQALQIHGPNFGVGGGPGGVSEALLAALSMLEAKRLPGVWVVLTCLDPELPPDESGKMPAQTQCVGLALALTPNPLGRSRIRLQIVCGKEPLDRTSSSPAARNGESIRSEAAGFDLPRLEMLLQLLHDQHGGETTIVQLHQSGCRIELSLSQQRSDAGSRMVRPAAHSSFGLVPSALGSAEAKS